MTLPTIEVYSDPHCPWAYLACYRLQRVWPEYANQVRIVWRALALEYINEQGTPKHILDAEIDLMQRIEPELPIRYWPRREWQWPVTFWPAFEAIACAQAQSDAAAFELSWAIRYGFFAEGRSPSLRHELLDMARGVAEQGVLDLDRFQEDWDNGRYKADVLAESKRGWHELKVEGSPTFVLPDGRQVSNLAAGKKDLDEEQGVIHSYTPYEGDPLDAFRDLLRSAAGSA